MERIPHNLIPMEIREFIRETPHNSLSGYRFLWSRDMYINIRETFLPSEVKKEKYIFAF